MADLLRLAWTATHTVFVGIAVMAVSFVPGGYPLVLRMARGWMRLNIWTFGVQVDCDGLENVPRDSPVVFMSNHQSLFDIAGIILTLPGERRFVAKKELTRIPFFGWCIVTTRQIVVDRGNNAKAVASMRRAAERIREGNTVVVFPEGTRSEDGTLRAFKSGGFHLALQARVPIVPVTVSGSQRILTKGRLRTGGGRLLVRYGKPIPTEGLSADDRHALKRRVREAIAQGYDPVLQGPPRIDPPLDAPA